MPAHAPLEDPAVAPTPAVDAARTHERLAFASALDRLALDAYHERRYKDACAQFLGALAIREEVLGTASVAVADAFNNVGVTLRKLGQLDRARMHFERALEIRKTVQGGEHPQIATTLSNLGNVFVCQGEVDLAAAHYERAVEIRERAGLAENSGAIRLATNIGVAHQLQRRYTVSRDPRAHVEVSGEIASAPVTTHVSVPVRGAPVLPKPGRLVPAGDGAVPYIETQRTSQIVVDPDVAPRKVPKQRTMQLDLESQLVQEAAPPPLQVTKQRTQQLDLDSALVEEVQLPPALPPPLPKVRLPKVRVARATLPKPGAAKHALPKPTLSKTLPKPTLVPPPAPSDALKPSKVPTEKVSAVAVDPLHLAEMSEADDLVPVEDDFSLDAVVTGRRPDLRWRTAATVAVFGAIGFAIAALLL